jgi:hypothetical protein
MDRINYIQNTKIFKMIKSNGLNIWDKFHPATGVTTTNPVTTNPVGIQETNSRRLRPSPHLHLHLHRVLLPLVLLMNRLVACSS